MSRTNGAGANGVRRHRAVPKAHVAGISIYNPCVSVRDGGAKPGHPGEALSAAADLLRFANG
ncbi:MAG: hypothetical protein QOG83_3114, partial [Alphaproteobacteria bacterium]|nr:hypothetical protein [Alphaproteobacteria bacterium]